MSTEPYVGEIMLVSFNYPPRGWAFCNGQLLPIQQNQLLFAYLGTMYGGNGQTNFALPDLRERVPMHAGQGHTQGERAGLATHTLTAAEMPAHTHAAQASGSNAGSSAPAGNVLAATAGLYGAPGAATALDSSSVTFVGGSQPHSNEQPFLTLNFVIALQGVAPARS